MKTQIWRRCGAALLAMCILLFSICACGSKSQNSAGKGSEVYAQYVIGIMDANYKAVFDQYKEVTGASDSEAQALYEVNAEDFASLIESALSIKEDLVSQEIRDRVIALAKKLYGQTRYTASDVYRDGDTYTIAVELEPVDFYGTFQTAYEGALNTFNSQITNGQLAPATEMEYEEAYAKLVMDAVEPAADQVRYAAKTTVNITLDYDKENNMYDVKNEEIQAMDQKVVFIDR